jgi:myxalamid-type polyketide synthase MxaB
VSSFGVGGTNAHVILEEAPHLPVAAEEEMPQTYLLPLSAHTPQALKRTAQSFQDFLNEQPEVTLRDICYTAGVRRNHHGHRLTVIGNTAKDLIENLRGFQQGKILLGVASHSQKVEGHQKLAFVFSGQGQQRWNMGRELLECEPVFRAVIEQCSALFDQYASFSFMTELTAPEEKSRLDQTEITQPAIFAVQVALVALWRSWGIVPQAVLGHSVGEIAAAYVANAISLEEAVRLVFHRGRLMQKATGLGKMAAVEIPYGEAEKWIADYRNSLSIAAINSPTSTVLSGQTEALDAVLRSLQEKGIRTQVLPVNYAFHSPQMDSYQKALIDDLGGFAPHRSTIPIYSTVTGTVVKGNEIDAAYWARNIREPVNFDAAVASLLADEFSVFVEVGAHPVLSGYVDQILRHHKAQGNILASLRGKKPEQKTMLIALGELHTLGYEVDWNKLYPSGHVVSLPPFSWQRKRYWIDVVSTGPKAGPVLTKGFHPLLGSRLRSPAIKNIVYESQLSTTSPEFLGDHSIFGNVILPATAYLELALAAIRDSYRSNAFELKDVVILAAMPLSHEATRTVQVILQNEEAKQGSFQLFSSLNDSEEWTLHAHGKFVDANETTPIAVDVQVEQLQKQLSETISAELHYQAFLERGNEFGPGFQGVKKIWRSIEQQQAMGQIQLPDKLVAELDSYQFHPALLDACLQVLTAILPPTTDTYLPIGLDSLRIYPYLGINLWSHVRMRPDIDVNSEIIRADFHVINNEGQTVAEMSGLRLKRTTRDALSLIMGKQASINSGPAFYEVNWKPMPLAASPRSTQPGNWLIFADQSGVGTKIADFFSAYGHTCVLVYRDEDLQSVDRNTWMVNPTAPNGIAKLLIEALPDKDQAWRGVIYLWALDTEKDRAPQELQEGVFGSALQLVQTLIRTRDASYPGLWVITSGAQPVKDDVEAIAQAPIWGMGNTIALEYPQLTCVRIDIDPVPAVDNAQNIFDEILAETNETRIAFRSGVRYVARLLENKISSALSAPTFAREVNGCQPMQLNIPVSHTLDDLEIQPATRHEPKPGEVEIQVQATGLNFRDVLRVLGMYPDEATSLGNECVGTIVRLGDGVKEFTIGDQVLAIASGSFSTFVTTPTDLVIRKPEHLSLEEAATIPIAFLTAHYALNHLAKIKAHDKVLIHAATGGVGLAAVHVAKRAGAEIFGTAGNVEKREYLKSLGVQHVLDSRSLNFADEIMEITHGQGVDIVLNSLAGEFIDKSFSILSEHGCFLEIGKTNVWDQERAAKVKPNASYFVIFLGEIFDRDPHLTQTMLQELIVEFKSGNLLPLPHKTFSITDVKEAFRYMVHAKHIGKIVVTYPREERNPDKSLIRSDATYLITGGLGGLGLVTARWLIDQGATHLVLFSRTTRSDVDVEALKKINDAEIVLMCGDVSRREDVAKLLNEIRQNMPALRGIFHAAGVVADGVLAQQDWAHFTEVMNPKISGTWYLHELTQGMDLDFFVMYSSVASIFGSAGQGNYAAANSFLDAFAHYRRSKGLPALSVNWGSWKKLGMTARLDPRDQLRFEKQGIDGITPEEGMKALQTLLENNSAAQAAVLSIRWDAYLRSTSSPFFADIAGQYRVQRAVESKQESGFLQEFNSLPSARQQQMLRTFLRQQVHIVLGLDASETIDLNQPLRELGLDSLIAVELRNLLGSSLKADLPATLLFDYPTITALANHLFSEVLHKANGKQNEVAFKPATQMAASTELKIEDLSDADAEALLLAELENKETKGAKK